MWFIATFSHVLETKKKNCAIKLRTIKNGTFAAVAIERIVVKHWNRAKNTFKKDLTKHERTHRHTQNQKSEWRMKKQKVSGTKQFELLTIKSNMKRSRALRLEAGIEHTQRSIRDIEMRIVLVHTCVWLWIANQMKQNPRSKQFHSNHQVMCVCA